MCYDYEQPKGGIIQPVATKCRSRQLFDAAESLIDESRKLANANSFDAVNHGLIKVRHAVAVFDRLNRGI
uniref:Uncharacterized protein n=1 Tax=Corticoviridae sp. TaxID=2832474 RepID=A0A8D9PE02_9VIRU|nr:MAG TPA: hypothetical protein [Corticoviridae sp.]